MTQAHTEQGRTEMSGRCLCGAVRFTAVPKAHEMVACHCGMCRRWSAGPFLAVSCGTSVKVEDETALGVFVSSDWAERLFCKFCGTSLFWRMRETGEIEVNAQALDDPSMFTFTAEIFVDEQPSNYAFAGERAGLTGAEVIAMFSQGKD